VNGRAIVMPGVSSGLDCRPKPVRTTPGCARLAVTRGAVQPAGKLAREQDAGQLAVGRGTPAVPSALRVRVIEVRAGGGVRVGGHGDHPRGRGRRQLGSQQVRQQEGRQVVEREHVLRAVWGDPPLAGHQAGVADEHVDALQPCQPARAPAPGRRGRRPAPAAPCRSRTSRP
jgi:hypothetical protein